MQNHLNSCPMDGRWTVAAIILLLGLAVAMPSFAQDSQQSSIPSPTPIPQPTPIPAPDIPALAAADADTARLAVASAAPDARLQEIQQKFPDEQDRIKQLREEARKQLKMPGPASMLKETEKSWGRARDRLDQWLAELASDSSAMDDTLDNLNTRVTLWQLTRDHETKNSLPKAIRQQITDTIKALTDAENQVRTARDAILNLQAAVAQEKSVVDEMLVELQQETSKRTKGAMGIDSPPLWKAFGADKNDGDALEQFKTARDEHQRSLRNFVVDQSQLLVLWVLIWPALTALMVAMRRKAEVWAQQDTSLKRAVAVLSRPVSAALVLSALLFTVLEPNAPSAWTGLVNLLVVLAVVRLLLNLLPKPFRAASSYVVLLFILRLAVQLAPEGFAIYRLALLGLAAGGLVICAWLNRTLKANPDTLPKKWQKPVHLAIGLSFLLFSAGAIADIVGSVGFSTLVLTGSATMMLAAFFWWLIAVMLRSMVRVGLLTNTARRIGIAPAHSEKVRATVFRMITFLTIVGWLAVSLRAFLLLDSLLMMIHKALVWSVKIGDISFDPGDLLIFGFIIWLSFKIAAFIEFVFAVDVVPRADLPKGVPETISRLTSYVVIAIGAVIGSAAAGFDISKLTIMISALGVGIGFGLQNIVNNFVSGLILLFERPIRVGDTLEIGDTGGNVETIGMRASIVKTWDGAEIIVPNADFISQQVVNWTLNQNRHRMVITVGVSYDTNPEQAAEIIVGVANDHKDVDATPNPACLFMGFGDSSLDFSLRAWTAESRYMSVASDLRYEIFRKLTEAGIEIPFPQRDVHMRTPQEDGVSVAEVRKQEEAPAQDGADGSDTAAEKPGG
jgi:potassium-dependent mechanosensitive channel